MINYNFVNQVWALIPARSGSKRLKSKNLKKINNLSLIARAIKVCKKTKNINRIFLTTNSKKIQREGLKYGVEAPFLRSQKNSSDTSNDFEVLKEFLEKISIIEKNFTKVFNIY